MSGYRLLIVEDDAVYRQLICELLMQIAPCACQIQQAVDGAAGLAALRTDAFDCILLDSHLPDMHGLEFLTAAAVNGEQQCAVVLITDQGREVVAVEAMERGAQDYVVKELMNADCLWQTLTRAVSKHQLQQLLATSLSDLRLSNLALEQEVIKRKAAEAEARAARDAAEKASEAKTRFIAMVSHELRTPLNGVLGYAQLLRIEGSLSARQDTHLDAMMQAGRHSLDLIERLLDFANFETGGVKLSPTEVSVRDLAEGCIAFIGPMAADRGLALRLVQSHDVPKEIVADPARLREVLLNLLGNAVKHTDTGSVELRLSAGASLGALRVEIADIGRGIDGPNRKQLFKDFERLDETMSVEGAGLGLAIAARIVGLMGGTIKCLPNPACASPNGTNTTSGSIFWFELPARELVSAAPAQTARAASIKNVLLVDDIRINRDIIGAFLKAAGHVVTLAESGPEAIQLAAKQQFDMVLMDVRMPGMDGLEATRRIRALPGALGQMPILALTAHALSDQAAKCAEAGLDAHIIKPINYDTLIDEVNRAARRVPLAENAARPAERIIDLMSASVLPSRFDRSALDRLFTLLPREEIVVVLQSFRERLIEATQLLDQEATPPRLVDAAHGLTSPAAIFGFLSLSALTQNFEFAVTQDAARAPRLALALQPELSEAQTILDLVIKECGMRSPPSGRSYLRNGEKSGLAR